MTWHRVLLQISLQAPAVDTQSSSKCFFSLTVSERFVIQRLEAFRKLMTELLIFFGSLHKNA